MTDTIQPATQEKGNVTLHLSQPIPTPEEMRKELEACGWQYMSAHVWKSPSGALFLGPAGAWRKMRDHPQLNIAGPKREVSIRPELEQEGLG